MSSQGDWNMNNSTSNQSPEISEVIQYIAEGTRDIVNAMKNLDEEKEKELNFEESVQKIIDKSNIEKELYRKDFNEKREKIRGKFNRRK